VETQQAGNGSACAVVIYKVWRLARVLYLLILASGVYMVNKPSIQSIPSLDLFPFSGVQ
jgi:hypothetical protein